jgi:hypothetical protein
MVSRGVKLEEESLQLSFCSALCWRLSKIAQLLLEACEDVAVQRLRNMGTVCRKAHNVDPKSRAVLPERRTQPRRMSIKVQKCARRCHLNGCGDLFLSLWLR